MLVTQVAVILGRIDAIWPPRTQPSDAERAEWAGFLQRMDYHVSERAIDVMKTQLAWRPTMADFKSAYNTASAMGDDSLPQLPAAKGAQSRDYESEYGQHRDDWVYCWKCDMAISLADRCEHPCYREGKGLHHAHCPRKGSAPAIPVHLKLARAQRAA